MAGGNSIARRDQAGALAPAAPSAAFTLLDIYSPGGVSTEAPRVEALATISAGERLYKDGKGGYSTTPTPADKLGQPSRSRDGTIKLHDRTDRAPGLRKALAARQFRAVTVAFPFNDVREFIKLRFTRYTASQLQVFGDETHLMVLGQGGYQRVEAGTDVFARELATCKVSVSVFFCLAEWGADGPEIVFPDGIAAFYRLRFTSRHSLNSILAGIDSVAKFTQGRIAGVPFDLAIDYREVADKTGSKRTIPVWTAVPKPPAAFRLTSRNFADVMGLALDQGEALMLPVLPEPTFEEAVAEGEPTDLDDQIIEGTVLDPSDDDVSRMAAGGGCDARRYENQFFSIVGRNALRDPDKRMAFLERHTANLRPALRTASLATFLERATDKEATELMVAVNDATVKEIEARQERGEAPPARVVEVKRSYEDLFPADDAPAGPAGAGLERGRPVASAATPVFADDDPAEAGADGAAEAATDGDAADQAADAGPGGLSRPDPESSYTLSEYRLFHARAQAYLLKLDPDTEVTDSHELTKTSVRPALAAVYGRIDDIEAALGGGPDAAPEGDDLGLVDAF